jgi:drug/metabolite transporter (DMT)-like permease
MKKLKLPVIAALSAALLFGISIPASKWILDYISPFTLAGLLYLGAAIGVFPSVLKNRFTAKPVKYSKRTILLLGGAVFSGGILGPVLLLLSLKVANSASISLWLNLELVATAILGALFFKEHISVYSGLAIMGTLCASVLISLGEGSSGILAGSLVFAACIAWGLDNHFTSLIDGIPPGLSTFWKGLIAGIINLSIGLATESVYLEFKTIGFALLIGIFSYGISIVLYVASAQQLGATRSQVIFSSSPFWGVLFSLILLNEHISIIQISAGIIMLLSIVILVLENHSHDHEHHFLEHEHWHSYKDGHHDHHEKEENNTTVLHSHRHRHKPYIHSHVHFPDLHHRHDHGN